MITLPKKPGRKSAASLAIVPTKVPEHKVATSKLPRPPAHLSADAAVWWNAVVADFDLELHHLRLLQSAAEAWDRMQQARQALADHGGLTFSDDKGTIKAHPAVAMERDARTGFARLVRELDLDAGAPAERSRPPALHSNRRN
jgi:P27 family predicted phage terminase small subunit